MAVPEINKKLHDELEAMGFSLPRATRALHYSGNSSVEDAINWVVDHESDPDIDQMPLVPVNIDIEASKPSFMTEKVRLKAQELRDRGRRRKEVKENKSEREREKERIKAGKELMEAKRIAEENERKRSLVLREAEKEEEKRARERIRQKLHQDKVERRRLGLPPDDPAFVKPATHRMQTEKESLPVKADTLPVKFSTKAELMGECLRSLRRNHKDDDAKVKKAFQTLLVYVRNVAKDPNEEKFRKIRFSNPAFQDRVGRFEEGIEFLELCGFERVEGGKYLYIPKDKVEIEVIKSAGTQLHSAITNPFFGLISRKD